MWLDICFGCNDCIERKCMPYCSQKLVWANFGQHCHNLLDIDQVWKTVTIQLWKSSKLVHSALMSRKPHQSARANGQLKKMCSRFSGWSHPWAHDNKLIVMWWFLKTSELGRPLWSNLQINKLFFGASYVDGHKIFQNEWVVFDWSCWEQYWYPFCAV